MFTGKLLDVSLLGISEDAQESTLWSVVTPDK